MRRAVGSVLAQAASARLAARTGLADVVLPLCVAIPLTGTRGYAAKGDGGVGRQNRTQALIDMMSPGEEVVSWSEEELADAAKRAKEYSRQKMREHRAWQKQVMTKVKLRDAAIEALPTEALRAAARAPDLSPFPSHRQVWLETPPHEQGVASGDDESKMDTRRRKIGTKM